MTDAEDGKTLQQFVDEAADMINAGYSSGDTEVEVCEEGSSSANEEPVVENEPDRIAEVHASLPDAENVPRLEKQLAFAFTSHASEQGNAFSGFKLPQITPSSISEKPVAAASPSLSRNGAGTLNRTNPFSTSLLEGKTNHKFPHAQQNSLIGNYYTNHTEHTVCGSQPKRSRWKPGCNGWAKVLQALVLATNIFTCVVTTGSDLILRENMSGMEELLREQTRRLQQMQGDMETFVTSGNAKNLSCPPTTNETYGKVGARSQKLPERNMRDLPSAQMSQFSLSGAQDIFKSLFRESIVSP